MRVIRLWWLGILILGSRAPACAADETKVPVFVGYASLPGLTAFAIYDPATNESSPWLKVGEVWHGYTFAAFDPKSEKLTLRKDSVDLSLNLRPSKVTDAALGPRLAKGTYSISDGKIVYSRDAQLTIGPGILISASSGTMTANADQTIISGDLEIVGIGATAAIMTGAEVRFSEGKLIVQAGRVTMRPLNPAPAQTR